jgi:hypothetical protein
MAKIGTTYAGLATFAALGVDDPIEKPVVPYSVVRNQSGGAMGVGWAQAVLEWPFLSNADRQTLRTIIPGASASVFVELPDETYTPTTYTGAALWPELRPENSQAVRFQLRLVNLVEYTP